MQMAMQTAQPRRGPPARPPRAAAGRATALHISFAARAGYLPAPPSIPPCHSASPRPPTQCRSDSESDSGPHCRDESIHRRAQPSC